MADKKLKDITDIFEAERGKLIPLSKPSWVVLERYRLHLEGVAFFETVAPEEAEVYVLGRKIRKDVTGINAETFPIQFYKYKE
ncbi:MAG: hypothetical protein AABX91_01405 [Nanoarchaeota archaeon]